MKLRAQDNDPKIAPFGSWKSPITAEFVTNQVVGLSEIQLDGERVYWLESRPSEQGRSAVVLAEDGGKKDTIAAPYNARTRVHEYGGGSYLAVDHSIVFSHFVDNALYIAGQDGEPKQLTSPNENRYGDLVLDPFRSRLICIAEAHVPGSAEPENKIVTVNLENGAVRSLVEGCDFYSSPVVSPVGSRMAWLCWNHPNMPWDGTELWTAKFAPDGSLESASQAAGGIDESIFQPRWSPDGILYYVSDRDGWWNLYRLIDGVAESLWVKDAEFGEPQWVFGQSTYAFAGPDTLICSYTHSGVWHLASIDTVSGKVTEIETPYTVISSVEADQDRCLFIGASPDRPAEIVELDLTTGKYSALQRSSEALVPEAYLSIAEPIEFPTAGGNVAYGNYYPPKNDDCSAPDGELPPLLVACHGGPTAAAYSQFSPAVQFWTSRGFAFVQVNYGGSTGYGREYHQRLNGCWGIVDVEDCINCALYLSDIGKADGSRLTIHGGSAGGYTALCALTFHEFFAAGASLYGVSDLEALAKDTHKFESRYLDRLVGPYPERKDIYVERSPIHFVDKLSAPIIFFQGLDDNVVPPDQATKMVDALQKQNIPVAYVAFEGEGHGFRRSDSIRSCLESHLAFYAEVFNITLAD